MIFQDFDKTAVVSKFGHTTYANIYMGEPLGPRQARECLPLGPSPPWSWLCVGALDLSSLTPSPSISYHCLYCLWFRPCAFCLQLGWLSESLWNVERVLARRCLVG